MIISTRWFTFQGFRRADLAGIPYGFFLMWKRSPRIHQEPNIAGGRTAAGYYRLSLLLPNSFWFGFTGTHGGRNLGTGHGPHVCRDLSSSRVTA